ncbi:ATPase [Rhodospirillaceae bacterium LM-1]|nr:ATPase [Rhodospirillaceae bacterium LM-1]
MFFNRNTSGLTPLAVFRDLKDRGELKPDPAQSLVAEKLESLFHALKDYHPSQGETGWRERFGLTRRKETEAPPMGLYIYGEVGRGKSMLMDLFFQTVTIAGKRRVHFHEFMRDIHQEIHKWRQMPGREKLDPLPRMARHIAEDVWLLCLDELQILDIADAMIVGRLFQSLLDNGVVIVATSNRPPHDLYKDGLQRERFLPFIELINQRFDVVELASGQDYRLNRLKGHPVYHAPLGAEAEAALEYAFTLLSAGAQEEEIAIQVLGHELIVPRARDKVARFTFAQLCDSPLGAVDYLALASRFVALIVSEVPLLSPDRRDAAKRFVTLVDALYDHRCILVCSAAAPPEDLYPKGDGAFEFQRTVSRLTEMQSRDYLASSHLA